MKRANIRRSNLQSKIFRAYLFLSCLILFSFAVFFYTYVSRQITDSQISSMETLNTSFYTQIESALKDLDTVSTNINYSNISKNILDNSYNLNISYSILNEMSDLFVSISGTEVKADQVNLYDFSGNVLQSGMSTLVKETSLQQAQRLSDFLSLEDDKLITPPYQTDMYSRFSNTEPWYVSIYRPFYNQYRREVGTIEVVKQCKSIFKSIISYRKRNKNSETHIYIFDANGHLIYPYEVTSEETEKIEKYYKVDFDTGNAFTSPINQQQEYAAKTVSSYSGYTYMTVQSKQMILKPVHRMLMILLIVFLIFLIISVLISHRLSRSLVKPIKHLKHIIQRLEIDTLGQEKATSYPVSVNELEELYQAYQNMSDSLKDSMNKLIKSQEQEMKSRTLALQAQMNPHFYYNSLSSISVLAENGDNDVVVKMCHNLSNIMRYITTTSSIAVTLRDEIDYVKKYLYCMKVRYQSSLDYEINVDETLMEEKVPKLIIQPIVENAIKYGSDCLPPWNISVKSVITDEYWKIEIQDSGTGFTPDAIAKISQNIETANSNLGMPDMKINGLGTLNVYLRWKLFCKDDIIFTYGNTTDGHGIVTIGRYFPKEMEK